MAGAKVEPIKLSKQVMKNLLDTQADLERIKVELERAIAAGVPMCDELDRGCDELMERINKIKAVYMKGQ